MACFQVDVLDKSAEINWNPFILEGLLMNNTLFGYLSLEKICRTDSMQNTSTPTKYQNTHQIPKTPPHPHPTNYLKANYTPENQHGTQKWRFGRWISFSKGWFSGSMSIFRGVNNHTAVLILSGNDTPSSCFDPFCFIIPRGLVVWCLIPQWYGKSQCYWRT